MITFTEHLTVFPDLPEEGQIPMFPEYIVSPNDVGLIISENNNSIRFLMAGVILWVDKNFEGTKFLRDY